MKVQITLEIISCQDCPWYHQGTILLDDGNFEDSACMKHEHLKWLTDSPNLPDWCPLIEFKQE